MNDPRLIQIGEQRASSTKRWLSCVGSAIICGGEISTTDEFAAEGTAAHTLLEYCLRFDGDPTDSVGSTIVVDEGPDERYEVEVTKEMADAVAVAIDWIKENLSANFVAEKKMTGAAIGLPQWTGHVDVSDYVEAARMLTVVDFKYGAGVAVKAYENKQGLSYAAMSMPHVGPVETVRIVIIQPRRQNPFESETADVWETDFGRIVSHIQEVSETSRVIDWLKDNPEHAKDRLTPGDHCQFCPALLKCPAIHEPVREVAASGFDDVGFLLSLTPDEVAYWYANKKRVTKWLGVLSDRARQLADAGKLPGYKLVQALENRSWIDEPKAYEALVAAGIDPDDLNVVTPDKLRSPSQTEKLELPEGMRRKDLAELVKQHTKRPPKGFTIVKDDDPRPNAVTDAAAEFDDEDF